MLLVLTTVSSAVGDTGSNPTGKCIFFFKISEMFRPVDENKLLFDK